MKQDPREKAATFLHRKNTFEFEGDKIQLALINRESRPLRAKWWKGKEAYIIAVDLNGNFLLSHCDGSVRYWVHADQKDYTLYPSVKDFVNSLIETECD